MIENNKNQPLVSVVMATYNENPQIIKKSVLSILNQSYTNFEFIIVDDSDDEQTVKTLQELAKDRRIKLIQGDTRHGFIKSLNIGLELCGGKYIARMDGDDISHRERLKRQVQYLENNKKVSLVGTQILVIDENGKKLSVRRYPCKGARLWLYAAVRSPVAHPAVMFRRKIVEQGYRYNENLEKSEDLEMWLKIWNAGFRIENMPDLLLKYRVDGRFIDKRISDVREEHDTVKIRRMYATWKRPVFSLLSNGMSVIRMVTPKTLKAAIYRNENKHI